MLTNQIITFKKTKIRSSIGDITVNRNKHSGTRFIEAKCDIPFINTVGNIHQNVNSKCYRLYSKNIH